MDFSSAKRSSIPSMLHPSYSVRPSCMLFFQMGITVSLPLPPPPSVSLNSARLLSSFVTVLADVTFSAMWTAQRSTVQRLISQHLRSPIFLLLMLLRSTTHCHLMTALSANRVQANPAIWINRLTDNAFMIAFWVHIKFRMMGPRRYCICGESW